MDDKTRPDATGYRFIGQPLPRKEDQRLITGEGRFSDDFNLAGQAYAAMVRSPYPHARIVAIDTARRARCRACSAFSPAPIAPPTDCGPIPHESGAVDQIRHEADRRRAAARCSSARIACCRVDKARHVGEAVAMVVAETEAQALDAAEAVACRLRGTALRARCRRLRCAPGAPAVWDEVPDNVLVDTLFGDAAATDARLRDGASRGHAWTFTSAASPRVPIEPRAALGALRRRERPLYALCRQRRRRAPEARARRRARHRARDACACSRPMSAAISARGTASMSNIGLVLWAARKLGRPVKYTATRSRGVSDRLSGPRSRHQASSSRLRADGRFLALRADNISNVGARCVSLSPLGKGVGAHHRLLRHSGGAPCARAPCSPTPCRPTPIAARAGRRSRSRSSG